MPESQTPYRLRHNDELAGGRFRIVAPVGRGGMAEVYRASDRKGKRYVALKFILENASDASEADLVLEERHSMMVTHVNVCRVYGFHEDREHGAFLSKEFVSGWPLTKALAQPYWFLAEEQKLRIAYGLCAGLQAIHKAGLMHRDLKPSNVLLENDGRVVVNDLDLARSHDASLPSPTDGTPSHQSPEQRRGEGVSQASDVYALGLILFELFYGEPAHPNGNPGGHLLKKLADDKSPLPNHMIDENVRCVIRDCLSEDPKQRPSVHSAAERLPDTLMHDGSPKSVHNLVARPLKQRLSKPWLLAYSAAAAVGLAMISWVSGFDLTQSVVEGEAPAVLESRARDLLLELGLSEGATYQASGYRYEPAQLTYLAEEMEGIDWQSLGDAPTPPITFWHRRAESRLLPWRQGSPFQRFDDPPSAAGTATVHLTPEGRLVAFDAAPDPVGWNEKPTGKAVDAEEVDWTPLFSAAQLDPDSIEETEPWLTPPHYADWRVAWKVRGTTRYETITVEAAAFRGQPVSFRTREPWIGSAGDGFFVEGVPRISSVIGRRLLLGWCIGALAVVIWIAYRNIRRGTADWNAAFRLGVVVTGLRLAVWLFGSDHLPEASEALLFLSTLARAVLAGALMWLIYMALEPAVRSKWPDLTSSWLRLLYGRFRDPLVGRDLLVGGLFAVVAVLCVPLYLSLHAAFGLEPPRPDRLGSLVWMVGQQVLDLRLEALGGTAPALAMQLYAAVHGLMVAFFAVVVVAVVRKIPWGAPPELRDAEDCQQEPPEKASQKWLGRGLAAALLACAVFPNAGHPVIDSLAALGVSTLWLFVLIRFGFLAAVTMTTLAWVLSSHPLTVDPSAWHLHGSLAALLLAGVVVAWGVYHAMTAAGGSGSCLATGKEPAPRRRRWGGAFAVRR